MRRGELCGLKWEDVDLDKGEVRVVRQLMKPKPQPVFGPPKNGMPRTITISPETAALLRKHKAHQAEIKLANRAAYHDYGLVFASEWPDAKRHRGILGHPLQLSHYTFRKFREVVRAAGVRLIKFHGLRHTSATLLLKAGVPVKVVQERLGHKNILITLNIYAHALPSMQKDAAAKLAELLYS